MRRARRVRTGHLGSAVLAALLASVSIGTAADDRSAGDRGAQAGSRSAGQAAEQARRQSGGRVLSTERQGSDGYRVKVLTPQGRVRKIDVPDQGR